MSEPSLEKYNQNGDQPEQQRVVEKGHRMKWLHSVEAMNNIQVALGVLVIVISILALSAKTWGEKLKQARDEDKSNERKQKDARIEKLTSDLQREQAKLAKYAPRRITPGQRAEFIKIINGNGVPKGRINLVAPNADGETITFAKELHSMFSEAGFDVNEPVASIQTNVRQAVGLYIYCRSGPEEPLHAGPIQRILTHFGFKTYGSINPDEPQGVVTLLVGHKPPVEE